MCSREVRDLLAENRRRWRALMALLDGAWRDGSRLHRPPRGGRIEQSLDETHIRRRWGVETDSGVARPVNLGNSPGLVRVAHRVPRA